MQKASITEPLTSSVQNANENQQHKPLTHSPLLANIVSEANPDGADLIESPIRRQRWEVNQSSTSLVSSKKNDSYQQLSILEDNQASDRQNKLATKTQLHRKPSLSFSLPPSPSTKNSKVDDHEHDNQVFEKNTVQISLPSSEPLTWREARKRMRFILQEYLDLSCNNNSISTITHELEDESDYDVNVNVNVNGETNNCISFWCKIFHQAVKCNLDCYFGSILFSVAMLIMSTSFYLLERNTNHHPDENHMKEYALDIHSSYIFTSVICTVLSITSLWAIKRTSFVSKNDIYSKKRRNVSSLLQILNKLEIAHEQADTYPYIVNSPICGDNDNNNNTSIWDESISDQNALSDIYTVYRLSSTSGDIRPRGRWHKIPSLLLVKGDFIALQTGDTAPADCKMVTSSRFGMVMNQRKMGNKKVSVAASTASTASTVIKGGDIVPPPARTQQRNNLQSLISWFPPGKSTMPEHSRKLLHLCNNKRVFEMQDAPMSQFLRSNTSSYQSPQVHRQLWEVRGFIFLISIAVFLLTSLVVAIRYGVSRENNPHHFYLPLIAALSISPVITPLTLFIQEIIGTSRILKFLHPMSSCNISAAGGEVNECTSSKPIQLFLQYFTHGLIARFGLLSNSLFHDKDVNLIDFPPITTCLFEKLGNVTAAAFIDDELICDPVLTPEQLLIPSSSGLKLFDLFPKHVETQEDLNKDDEIYEIKPSQRSRSSKEFTSKRFLQSGSDDSDSDWDEGVKDSTSVRRKKIMTALKQRMSRRRKSNDLMTSLKQRFKKTAPMLEVQFEDPSWWRYLPSFKCIGLSCLLLEEYQRNKRETKHCTIHNDQMMKGADDTCSDSRFRYFHGQAESALVSTICKFYPREHLRLLAQCIGFSMESNSNGALGDLSYYKEQKRIHILATRLLQERVQLDRHSVKYENIKTWGLLKPDATSIVIKDDRSRAHQLLTLGEPNAVIDFCTESWQGGISTIIPLSLYDRKEIMENAGKWKLADLDVTAFSYAPIPYSPKLEKEDYAEVYLVDNRSTSDVPAVPQSDDWSILKNQMFLGLLGSSISPRRNTSYLVKDSDNAGVRFVYFSSRNMRRTKEVASRMGIDVAWNSAISLQPLDDDDNDDDLRRENFGDDDFNAKLPHGVEEVIRHLKNVDNVPLLVRLFTDVTKKSTTEMIHVFRQHNDTVLSIGLSHNSRNEQIFAASSLSIGVDLLLNESNSQATSTDTARTRTSHAHNIHQSTSKLCPEEISVISSIAASSCIFNMPLVDGITDLPFVIDKGRASLSATKSAFGFILVAYVSFALLVLFSTCSLSQSVPYLSGSGAALSLLLVIPTLALAMSFSDQAEDSMSVVPMKNIKSENFGRGERQRLCVFVLLKALFPAAISQLIYLISFGSFIINFDAQIIIDHCGLTTFSWTNVVLCDAFGSYIGPATTSSGVVVITFHTVCMIVISASFLQGSIPINSTPTPVKRNTIWVFSVIVCLIYVILYTYFSLESGAFRHMPWYFYLIFVPSPLISLVLCEIVKQRESKHEQRAAKMRRLHFETRLGMWSPKANQ